MHPLLFKLFGFPLPTYGAAMALGFFVAILLSKRQAEKQGVSVSHLLNLSLVIFISAILFSA